MILIQIYGTERSGSSLLGAQLGMRIEDAACVGEYQFVALPARVQPEEQPCICGETDCAEARFQITARNDFDMSELFAGHSVIVDTSKQIYWYHAAALEAQRMGARVYRLLILPQPAAFARSKRKRGQRRFALKYLVYNFIAHRFCGIDRVVSLEDLVADQSGVLKQVCADLGLDQRKIPSDMHHIFGSRTLRRLGSDPVRQRKRAGGVPLPLGARIKIALLDPVHRYLLRHRCPQRQSLRVQSLFRRPFYAMRKQG